LNLERVAATYLKQGERGGHDESSLAKTLSAKVRIQLGCSLDNRHMGGAGGTLHEVWCENDACPYPAKVGYDLRAFECTKCNNVDQYIVENEKSSPWVLVVRGG
jgi:hypothetical protein